MYILLNNALPFYAVSAQCILSVSSKFYNAIILYLMLNRHLKFKGRPADPLNVNQQIGFRSCAAEEHLTRIRRGQGLKIIIDLSFQECVRASLTDACSAAEVRKDALLLGEVEQVLGFGIPLSGDPGL